VAVEPFAGGWVAIAEGDLNRLGLRASSLGQDLVLGRRVVDVAGRFRAVIGPLSAEGYQRFSGGEPVRRVEELIAALVSEPIEHEVVLWLAEDAAPAVRLGTSRLGKNSWLGGQRRQIRIRAEQAA
jgi:type VI secretion system protein ImpH